LNGLALCGLNQGRFDDAAETAGMLGRLYPREAGTVRLAAFLEYRAGRRDRAEAMLRARFPGPEAEKYLAEYQQLIQKGAS
jgi:hypothetical protein